jgi:hypothetical protein
MNPSDALWQMPFMRQQAVDVFADDTVYRVTYGRWWDASETDWTEGAVTWRTLVW